MRGLHLKVGIHDLYPRLFFGKTIHLGVQNILIVCHSNRMPNFDGTWIGCFYLNSSINQLYWELKITILNIS